MQVCEIVYQYPYILDNCLRVLYITLLYYLKIFPLFTFFLTGPRGVVCDIIALKCQDPEKVLKITMQRQLKVLMQSYARWKNFRSMKHLQQ